MKKSITYSLVIFILYVNPASSQIGGILKKVKNSVTNELLGNNKGEADTKTPEPKCACDPAELIAELGKYKVDYKELNISVLADGNVLMLDKLSDKYYIVKNGVTEGPYKKDDPKVAQFDTREQTDDKDGEKANAEAIIKMCNGYATKSGDKFLITFDGKTYGPYGMINKFVVSRSRSQFAAIVTETVITTAEDGKKMDQAVKNAKTDQEKMELAMQFTQQMQDKMMSGGGPAKIMPKMISNIPDIPSDNNAFIAGQLSGSMKFDEILLVSADKISNLQGKKVLSYSYQMCLPESLFISTDNSMWACYNYGTLTFSDGKTVSELFNPHLVKTDGKVYIAYMYYSPKKNSILQCKIPF
jgi:hypothetical protein